MSPTGAGDDLLVRTRAALLDALEALADQRRAIVVIGAQAVYLRTGGAEVALAETTKDSDLAVDPRFLDDDPQVQIAMERARFHRNFETNQPGAWLSPTGIDVDLMVPESLAGDPGRRAARLPPHDGKAFRRAPGLEAVVVDRSPMIVRALDPADARAYEVDVAGPAGLMVAKLHKIGERARSPHRLVNKDAHDLYRILRVVPTEDLLPAFRALLGDTLSREPTSIGIGYLSTLFAEGPDALGSATAGAAEEGVGDPEGVALAVSILADDLVQALG